MLNELEADQTPHYFCGDCKHFCHSPGCQKRIDHQRVKFAKPYFKSYDCNQFSGIPCSDFEPCEWLARAEEPWHGWEGYWARYVKYWLPYGNTNTTVAFTFGDDTSVRYHVPLMDFVNGTLIEGNTLKAIYKQYYKQSRKSPTGYELIKEPINGVVIPE